jgi:ATP-dependent Clp protease ATP-binding subunit ClpB
LTDSKGRTVNFKNTIVIMTTNLGSDIDPETIGRQEKMMQVFRSFFRPEFLNRVDDIVVFNAITQEVLRKIVDTQLVQFIQMVKKEKDIDMIVSDIAKDELGNI